MNTFRALVLLVAGAAVTWFSAPAAAQAANLAANPGFENAILTGPYPGPQGNWEPSDTAVTRQSTVVRTGGFALAISGPSASEWHTGDQDLAWNAGEPIYASAWVKTTFAPTGGQRAGLLVQFVGDALADAPVLGELKSDVGGTQDWRKLEVTGTAPAGTQQVRVRLFVWSDVTPIPSVQAYFDDVLTDKILQAPAPQTVLRNTGFENGLHDWQSAGQPAVAVTSPIFSGTYAAQATVGSVATQDFWSQTYQEISKGAGQPVHGAVRVKPSLNPSSTARAGLLLEFFNAAHGKIGEVKQEAGGTGDWRLLELFGTTPAGTATVRYSLFVWAGQGDTSAVGGIAAFDACVLNNATPPPPPAPGANVLKNPGFESGLVDWQGSGQPAGTVSSPVQAGTLSAVLRVNSTTAADFWSALYQETPLAAGASVYARAVIQPALAPLSDAKSGVLLQFLNSAGGVVGEFKREIGGTQSWRNVEVSALAPAGTVRVRYFAYLWAAKGDTLAVNGAAYIDSCILKQSTQQPVAQTTLRNGAFENGLHDWLVMRQATTPFAATAAARRTGVYGAEDTIENRLGGYYAALFQEIQVSAPGRGYTAQAWVRPTGIQGGSTGLLVQFYDALNQQIGSPVKREVSGTLAWTQLTLTGPLPAGAVKVRISVFVFGDQSGQGGKTSLDNVTFTTFAL